MAYIPITIDSQELYQLQRERDAYRNALEGIIIRYDNAVLEGDSELRFFLKNAVRLAKAVLIKEKEEAKE